MARKPTPFGQLRFLFNFALFTLPLAAVKVSRAIIRAWLSNLPLRPAIWNGFVGSLMVSTPPDQLQAILPSTFDTYSTWVLSKGREVDAEVLRADTSTRLLWIGPKRSSKVLLFFHGGGYVMPLLKGHLDWLEHIRTEASDAGIQLRVCILEYDLIPTHPYPRQMLQALFAFKHLLSSGYKPSDIVFGGDSAGGHLSLSLLSHLHNQRQFDSTDGKDRTSIDLVDNVRGCFLVSPLCSYDFNTPSYQRWFSADVLGRTVVRKWGNYLVGNSPWHHEISSGQGWGMALDVPETWWNNLNVVDRILVTGGYEEVFSDHIEQLGDVLLRNSKGDVDLYMANEAHDGPLVDFADGRAPSETTKTITRFIISSFMR